MKNKTITMYELIGLIAEGKAPMVIRYGETEYYRTDGNYRHEEITDDGDEDWNLFDSTSLNKLFLNDTIEILPEENDEWEDIEELNYTLPTKHEHGKLFYKDGHNNVLRQIDITILEKINQLIKNQKYLKERLDNVKDDVVFDYWKDKVESKDVY